MGVAVMTARRRPSREPRQTDHPETTDAVVRLSATCIYGSDLWRYRGIDHSTAHADGT